MMLPKKVIANNLGLDERKIEAAIRELRLAELIRYSAPAQDAPPMEMTKTQNDVL